MNGLRLLLTGSMVFGLASSADAQTSAGSPAGPVTASSTCTISGSATNLGALPPGTRVFFIPVLKIEHARSANAVQIRELAGSRDANAQVRDGAVYVRQDSQPLTSLDREPVKFSSALEVCVFGPGVTLTGSFASTTPDLVTR